MIVLVFAYLHAASFQMLQKTKCYRVLEGYIVYMYLYVCMRRSVRRGLYNIFILLTMHNDAKNRWKPFWWKVQLTINGRINSCALCYARARHSKMDRLFMMTSAHATAVSRHAPTCSARLELAWICAYDEINFWTQFWYEIHEIWLFRLRFFHKNTLFFFFFCLARLWFYR